LRGLSGGLSWRALFQACQLFESDFYAYDAAWLEVRKDVNWKQLHNLPIDKVRNNVIGFLNKWKCRLPYTDMLADGIRRAHLECVSLLEALEDETIEDWEPDKSKAVEGITLENSEILLRIYSRFAAIGERFSHVAASKVLHFLLPKLVVMWDNKIASSYGIPMTSRQYVYSFIPRMKEMANEAIETYRREKGCSREEAVLALNQFRSTKTIAKLLDEYNYMKFTRGANLEEPQNEVNQKIEVGNQLEVRAIEGRDGRTISRAPDGRAILFDNADPRSALIKVGDIVNVRVLRVANNYLIVRKVEDVKSRSKKETKIMERYDYDLVRMVLEREYSERLSYGEHIIIWEEDSAQIFGKSIRRAMPGKCVLEDATNPEDVTPTIPRHLGMKGYSSRIGKKSGRKYVEIWLPSSSIAKKNAYGIS